MGANSPPISSVKANEMNGNNYRNATEAQDRYWQFMVELAIHAYYLEEYLLYYQTVERRVKYFLAIMSSSSIATWAIWQKYILIWAFLIAFSQMLNAIKHLFPFAQREKIIRNILPELNNLFSEVELQYYNVANGLLTDYSIHEMTIKFKQRKDNIILKLNENALPESEKIMTKSESKASIYFDSYYGGDRNG